jgi:isoleucyl-tRNA synthetase
MDLKSTLNLPDPNFTIPMKADLPNLETRIQARWDEEGIYHLIQASRENAPSFVLHDGPPYTNSPIHIGTALNKILKDFVVKSRTMMGYRAPYVPGFDNHGLPIEQAVQRAFNEQKIKPTITELRQACRAHAAKYIGIQTEQFRRLGVFGLWEKPYVTMDYRFEAGIIRVFKALVEKGYVYKGLRPTLWSPTAQTALADTEIIYKDHVSKAIFVRFPLIEDPNGVLNQQTNVYTIIWTTTPWTIPSNLAVAFHPEFTYALVRVDGRQAPEAPDGTAYYVIAEALIERAAQTFGWTEYEVVQTLPGADLEYIVFRHPIFDRQSLGVLAD